MSVDKRLLDVFQGVFGEEVFGAGSHTLPEDASPESVEGWDSVNHVNLILALEAEFELQFETDEISELTSVAAIRARVAPE